MKIYVRVFSLLSHKSSWEKYKWKTLRVTCASDTEALPSLPCHTDMHSWKKWEHTDTPDMIFVKTFTLADIGPVIFCPVERDLLDHSSLCREAVKPI